MPEHRREDGDGEEQDRPRVPEVEGDRGEVPEGGAHGEGEHDRRPVGELAPGGRDVVDVDAALGAAPDGEQGSEEHGAEQERRGVRQSHDDVRDVGGHRAEDAHHRHGRPVDPRHVAVLAQLQGEREDERDQARQDGEDGRGRADRPVRHRLAHRGGQRLGDPERHGRDGDPDQTGGGGGADASAGPGGSGDAGGRPAPPRAGAGRAEVGGLTPSWWRARPRRTGRTPRSRANSPGGSQQVAGGPPGAGGRVRPGRTQAHR